jgi:hypothetical protein
VDSESVTIVEIRLARVMTDTGKMAFLFSAPNDYNAIEVLGLLEAGKFHVFKEMGKVD